MSSFGGLMVEYPLLAIDRFQGPGVLKARAYFLSHAHSDHMVGLDSQQFSQRLKSSTHVKLYCSEVTREFLLTDSRFIHLEPFLISLPIEEPTLITLCDDTNEKDKQVLVTLLAAGHCPGSVMFLFEGDEGNVLYTGDFRFAKGEAARMEPLHSGTSVKDIKSAYVDTTFCVPEAMYIPSREQSKDALLDLVEQHVQTSPTHMVRLACKAKYGYEYLFVEISKAFDLKVHVSPIVMAQYERVPDLAKHLTTDGSTTQVHACRYMDCSMNKATDVLVVVPSTMWFTSNAQPSDVLRKVGHRYRLCFSFHSSFSEVRDFLSYIRPVNIYPNVIPYRCTEEKINERLKDLKRYTKDCEVSETSSYKPLGKLKVSTRTVRRYNAASCKIGSDIEDELEVLFSDSSPLKRRRIQIQEEHHEGGHECSDNQQQRILLDGESYIAMDDSDLSSCELDLYDSAPGAEQSQSHKEDWKQPDDTSSESGDFVKSTKLGLTPHQTTQDSMSSRTPTVSSMPSETEEKFCSDVKLSNIKSKRSEISNWLRYLPNSSAVDRQISGERKRSRDDSLSMDDKHRREIKHVDSSDMNSSLITQSDNTKRDKFRFRSEVRSYQSPDKKQTVENKKESGDEYQSISNTCHQDTKSDDLSELKSSFAESDKTEEYKFSSSQDLFPQEKLQDSSQEEVPIKPEKSDSRKYQGLLDDNDCNQPKDVHNVDPGVQFHPLNSDSIRGKEASEHVDLRLIDASDRTQPFQHQGDSLLKLPDRMNRRGNVQTSESHQILADSWLHQTTPKSKDPVFHKTTSEIPSLGDNDKSGQSQGTNQSEETFLPSSQGSLISHVSSDFDIPCTPEGKKLHPSQVEEVKAMIARGDAIALVSCNKTILSD